MFELARIVVEAVTNSRDAEKAMIEARQAAQRAEMHCLQTRKQVMELSVMAEQLTTGSFCH